MIAADTLILLDTNIVVHFVRWNVVGQRIDQDHALQARRERPLISIVTAGEVESHAHKLGWAENKRQRLSEQLHELVLVPLAPGSIVTAYGEIDYFTEHVEQPARPMGKNDLWIAATAHATGATLMTADANFDHLAPRFFSLVRVDAKTGATILEK